MMDDRAIANIFVRTYKFSKDVLGPLAKKCTCGEIVPGVFTEGHFHVYNPDNGVWDAVHESEIDWWIQQLTNDIDQCPDQFGGKRQPMLVSAGRITSIRRLSAAALGDLNFFTDVKYRASFKNGVLDTDTKKLIAPCHLHKIKHTLNVPLISGPTPLWDELLRSTFNGDADAPDKIKLIQEFVGCALLGIATKLKRCLVFVGEGRNGKSTIQSVVEALFPPKLVAHSNPQTWANDYDRAELLNKRLNITSELPERELMESEAFKTIVEGGNIQARTPYVKKFDFQCMAAHIFATNTLLKTNDHTDGFYRRFIINQFNNQFKQGLDVALPIIAQELPCVAAKCIDAAFDVIAREFQYTIPSSATEAVENWRLEVDPYALFTEQCLVVNMTAGIQAFDLFKIFENWADYTGNKSHSMTLFGRRIKLRIPSTRVASGVVYHVDLTPIGKKIAQLRPYSTLSD